MNLMSPYELKMKLDLADDRAKFVKKHSLPGVMKNVIVTDDGHIHFFNSKGYDITKSIKSIEEAAFYNCSSLTDISIPDSVKNIGNDAFNSCGSLKRIVIPDSVTSIEEGTFYNCESLTSIIIPESVTRIGAYAFTGCSSLKSIVFKGKTLEEVMSMDCCPWGVEDESIFKSSGLV